MCKFFCFTQVIGGKSFSMGVIRKIKYQHILLKNEYKSRSATNHIKQDTHILFPPEINKLTLAFTTICNVNITMTYLAL